jgi:PAS domain S-box-containing protein
MPVPPAPAPAPDLSDELKLRYESALGVLLRCLLIILPVLALVSWSIGDTVAEKATIVLMFVVTAVMYAAYKRGHYTLVANATVLAMIVLSIQGVLAYGSVRSAGTFVFVAAVAAAGVFLPRSGLVATAALSIGSLGGLTWAEIHGFIHRDNFDVTLKAWFTYSAIIAIVGLVMHYSRQVVFAALDQQRTALRERDRIERDLRSNEEQMARMFDNSPAVISVQRASDWTYLKINKAFERIYGYAREDVLGRNDMNFWVNPETRDALRRKFSANGGRIENFAGRVRRKDGRAIDVLMSAEYSGEGDDRMVVTVITDVTRETLAREELNRSQDRFNKAFNFSPLGKTITRLSDGRFIEVNSANQRVLGYTQEDFRGKTASEAGVWVTEDARNAYVQMLRRDSRLTAYETRMRAKNSEVVPVRIWAELIDVDGETCALSYTINIAEEKKREALLLEVAKGVSADTGEAFFESLVQQLAKALDAHLVVVAETGPPGVLRGLAACSDGVLTPKQDYPLPGTPAEAVLACNKLYVHESELGRFFPESRAVVVHHGQAYMGIALRDADGTPIGILSVLWRNPIAHSSDREALMSIFAGRTNAELVRLRRDREILQLTETLEQRVRERTAELTAVNAELESFSYSVSHDLKSPLMTINGFTQILQKRLGNRLEATEQQLFSRVLGATARMEQLTTDMLSLARISRSDLHLDNVDLTTLARSVEEAERLRTPERQVDMVVSDGITARCDPHLARIVLDNLIGNAWKYSRRAEHARIELGVLPPRPDGRTVLFIRDNGVGFDMAFVGKLFKPFHRLHGANEFEGTGIGLATVHRIMERHGGCVDCTSVEGVGSTFYFTFDSVPDTCTPLVPLAPLASNHRETATALAA